LVIVAPWREDNSSLFEEAFFAFYLGFAVPDDRTLAITGPINEISQQYTVESGRRKYPEERFAATMPDILKYF
jgi:hypothetical protein